MKIKVNKEFGTFKPGMIVDVITCDGIPLSLFWRRRLADAEFDQCCEVIKKPSKPKSSKTKEPKE